MGMLTRTMTLVFCCLLTVAGCSGRQVAVSEMAGILNTGMAAFENDDDLEMLGQAFPANIKLVEALLANSPDNAELKVMLARLYASYTFAFLEPVLERDYFGLSPADLPLWSAVEQDPDRVRARALAYYLKGEDHALSALEQRWPGCRERLESRDGQAAFFQALSAEDVPALFWWAFNLGARINLERSSVALLAKAHLVETAMQRAVALDPAYQNGGAHLFLMAYYCSRPAMMGGDPAAAREHHRALMDIAGDDYRLGTVYFGRYVLQPAQDRQRFLDVMNQVAAAPAASRYRLYNAIAAVRARIYLRAVDDLFTEEEPP